MPIHDVGYRKWEGKKTAQISRWQIISSTGIRLAAKSPWVKRILFVAWLPVMYWGIGFFFVEKAIDSDVNMVASATEGLDLPKLSDVCLLYTSPSPRDLSTSRMPSSA